VSNLLLNIRFGEWHFQIDREWPWVSVSHSPYHAAIRKIAPDWLWFEVYYREPS